MARRADQGMRSVIALLLGVLFVAGCPEVASHDDDTPADDDSLADDDDADDDTSGSDDDSTADPCEGHCSNGIEDCGENGVDCGGLDCSACAPEMLWGEEATGKHPSVIAVRPDLVIVAYGRADRTTPVQYSCFDGASWSSPADLTAENTWRPNPAVDGNGTVHMAVNSYHGASVQSVYHTEFVGDCDGGSWTAMDLVSGGGDAMANSSTEPCIDVDENDDLWIGWSQARAVTLTQGNECGTDADCDAAYGADLYDCRGGFCWPFYDLYLSLGRADAWADPVDITAGWTGYFSHLAISVVHSELAFASWMKGDDGVDIYFAGWDGQQISAPEDTGLGMQFSDVVADEQFVHLMANGSASYRRKQVGGGWDEAFSLGSSSMDFPDLALDGEGTLHAVWNDGGVIRYRIGDAATGEWTQPAVAISTNPTSSHPWIDVDSVGFAHIVWAGGEDDGPIWYTKVRYEDLP